MKNIYLSIFMFFFLSTAASAETTIWVAPAEVKVTKLEEQNINTPSHVWSPRDGVVRLAGAGREHVSFQIVASCHKDTLKQVTLAWSDLKSSSGTIPSASIKAFLAALVKVYAPSTRFGKEGWYPDPLAPLTNPVNIYPDRWEDHKNQSFWIDIIIPPAQPGGKYSGEITVSAGGRKIASFAIELTVWNFTLPEYPNLFAMFNCSKGWLGPYYTPEKLGERTLDDVLVQYFDFLLARGIQPWFNPLLQPEYKDTGERIEISWPNDKWERHFLSHPAYKRVTFSVAPRDMEAFHDELKITPALRRKIEDWVGGIYRHYKEKGWADKLSFFGPLDEPNTREAYEILIEWGGVVRSIAPDISFQVTEQPLPQNPDWPSLTKVANDWVVHGEALEGNREELRRLSALGNHSSWYISCDQVYPMANYFIDEPGIDPRAVAWITYRYSLQGILYWAVNFWPEVRNPWNDPITWKRSECNAPLAGEGSLLYPGEEIRAYCRQENVKGPVSSVRLELLCQGLEDVEYLYKLVELGRAQDAERLCMELVVSTDTFSRDPARYAQIKAEAARLIEKGKAKK